LEKKYRILIISARYFPTSTARTYRWGTIAEFWTKKGNLVDIISSRSPHTQKQELLNGVKIYRVTDIFVSVRSLFFKDDSIKKILSEEGKKFSPKSSFTNRITKIFEFLWKNLHWPDSDFLWIIPAYLKAKKLTKHNNYDAIISVARPFSSHLIGLLTNRKKIRNWICDIGDPFSFDKNHRANNFFFYSKINKLVEKHIIMKSKKVSVTTRETAEEYVNFLGVNRNYFCIIPPLFSLSSSNEFSEVDAPERTEEIIRLYYFGSLYKDIRNPSFLLETLHTINKSNSSNKINVHFFGKSFDCMDEFERYNNERDPWIFVHGEVARNEVPKLMNEADILVNIGNTTYYQLPSKIIEYISTGKPILNVASTENDSSHSELRKYSSSMTIFKNKIDESSMKILNDFLTNPKPVLESEINTILKNHSLENISNKYIDLLKK